MPGETDGQARPVSLRLDMSVLFVHVGLTHPNIPLFNLPPLFYVPPRLSTTRTAIRTSGVLIVLVCSALGLYEDECSFFYEMWSGLFFSTDSVQHPWSMAIFSR